MLNLKKSKLIIDRLSSRMNSSFILRSVVIFITYSIYTIVIFYHRIAVIFTHYGLENVDTDGTIWYHWYLAKARALGISEFYNDILSFPTSFNFSYIPFYSLIYDIQSRLSAFLGSEYIIFVMNVSMLLSYPFAGYFAYLLSRKIWKHELFSFISGFVYTFTYYHVLMARGSLSLNHIFFIPLFFLVFLRFIEKPKFLNIIILIVTSDIFFKSNPYYIFFALIFSPTFIFINLKRFSKRELIQRIKLTLLASVILLISILSLNFDYIYMQRNVLSPTRASNIGREINKETELVSITKYIIPDAQSIYPGSISSSNNELFIGYGLLVIFLYAIIKLNDNNSKIIIWSIIFIILLTTHIGFFSILSDVYFQLFGSFRAVSRMIYVISLFLCLLIPPVLLNIKLNTKLNRVPIAVILIGILFLMDTIVLDPSLYRTSDFRKKYNYYASIKHDINPNSKAIILYPYSLINIDNGTPRNEQLLAQVGLDRKVVGGLSLIDYEEKKPYVYDYYQNLKDDTFINLYNAGVYNILVYHERKGLQFLNSITNNKYLRIVKSYKSNIKESRDITMLEITNIPNSPPKDYGTCVEENVLRFSICNASFTEGNSIIRLNANYSTEYIIYNISKMKFITSDKILRPQLLSDYSYTDIELSKIDIDSGDKLIYAIKYDIFNFIAQVFRMIFYSGLFIIFIVIYLRKKIHR